MKRKARQRSEAPARAEEFGGPGDREAAALVLLMKALVIVYGVLAYTVLRNERLASDNWLGIWNRWDAPHYLDLAREGYVGTGEHSHWIVFYPLYPWLVRACAFLLADDVAAAFFVSALASVAAGVLLRRLAALDERERVARGAVFFMLVFPTAYFLHIGYTESLFLALALGAFLAARTGRWPLAGALGALSCLTRVNGLALVPALCAESFTQFREGGREWRREWLWTALVPVGFIVYLLINWRVSGTPFAFLEVQSEHWAKSLAWPWVGVWSSLSSAGWRAPADAQMVVWQELFFTLVGLGCTVWCWLRARPSYAVWMTANWLLWTSTRFILSVPRYTLVMFPVYILCARIDERRPFWGRIITIWSLLSIALFAARFVQDLWAF